MRATGKPHASLTLSSSSTRLSCCGISCTTIAIAKLWLKKSRSICFASSPQAGQTPRTLGLIVKLHPVIVLRHIVHDHCDRQAMVEKVAIDLLRLESPGRADPTHPWPYRQAPPGYRVAAYRARPLRSPSYG